MRFLSRASLCMYGEGYYFHFPPTLLFVLFGPFILNVWVRLILPDSVLTISVFLSVSVSVSVSVCLCGGVFGGAPRYGSV